MTERTARNLFVESPSGADLRRLQSARKIVEYLAEVAPARFSVQLWDGSMVPLGPDVHPDFFVSISDPGVIGSILRWPTLENVLTHYSRGNIDFHGGDLIDFLEVARNTDTPKGFKARNLNKWFLFRQSLPFLFTPSKSRNSRHGWARDETGKDESQRNNTEFIQFHYDLGNDFYKLFLDPEMQYSCAHFTDWNDTLEQAQKNKLNMICRKLQLKSGERFLDIGCGWGGLICHAATNYGVSAHGVTLSQEQYDLSVEKIERLGLKDRVSVELRDYSSLEGTYDKIASIGMYEHVGIANYPTYFKTIRQLIRDRGMVLNHGITRRAKSNRKRFNKISPEKRIIKKYIFPGSELDHIGHTLESMEACGFEIHDVEGLRDHYALTSRMWCKRLSANEDKAIELVGYERYRIWIAYLAGVSYSFTDGSLRVYQVVATKHKSKGASGQPSTRSHLYE